MITEANKTEIQKAGGGVAGGGGGIGGVSVSANNGPSLHAHHSQPHLVHPHTHQTQHHVNYECAGCKKRIGDRFMLKALELFWHEDCLKCACCDCRLGEVGSTLFTKANLILCKRDYLRLFGMTGYCSACSKMIPAFEMVMRARGNVYHLECFACQQCNHRFCVGDRFYLCDNKILCEYDYEERQVFAHLPSFSVEHLKRTNVTQGGREDGSTNRYSTPDSALNCGTKQVN